MCQAVTHSPIFLPGPSHISFHFNKLTDTAGGHKCCFFCFLNYKGCFLLLKLELLKTKIDFIKRNEPTRVSCSVISEEAKRANEGEDNCNDEGKIIQVAIRADYSHM